MCLSMENHFPHISPTDDNQPSKCSYDIKKRPIVIAGVVVSCIIILIIIILLAVLV